MNKKLLIIGIIFVFVVGFLMFFSSDKYKIVEEDLYTIVAEDGKATLKIPKEALPSGLTSEEISLSNVSVNDDVVAYELKPDGTVFEKNISLEVSLDNAAGTVPLPFIILSDGESVEPIGGWKTDINTSTGVTLISVPISHFSVLGITMSPSYRFFNGVIEAPGKVYLEEIINYTGTLKRMPESSVLYNSAFNPWVTTRYDDDGYILGRTAYRLKGGTIKVTGKALADWWIVSPDKEFMDKPPLSDFAGGEIKVSSNEFRCDEIGKGSVHFEFDLTYTGEAVDIESDDAYGTNSRAESVLGVEKEGGGKVRISKELECIARPSLLDENNVSITEKESYLIGDIFGVASADPARVECPDAKYLSPERGGVSMDVFKLKDGKCYTVKQFGNSSSPDLCEEVHYHTQLTSLGGNVLNDSQPCGAAIQSDILKSAAIYVQPTAK